MISLHNTQDASSLDYSWSNRFLILAVAGILFLTMYPFEISHAKPSWHGLPFLLGRDTKAGGPLDIVLNILLFMPYGFAIGAKFLRRGTPRRTILIYTGLAGALFSYAIEFTQLYVPFRDSGWEDVLTNTTGAFLGCIVAFFFADWVFRRLSNVQRDAQAWATPRRLATALLIYLGVWFVVSTFLIQKISLEDWRSDCFLVFGNNPEGLRPWRGKVLQVQIWNRALSKGIAEQLTSSARTPQMDDPLVNLDFGGQDSSNGANTEPQTASRAVTIAASPTLSNYVIDNVKQSNQFSIRAVLLPGLATNGWIVSLSQKSGFADFYMGQQDDDVVFWFRSPVTARWRNMYWKIPNALSDSGVRRVMFSYDGSSLRSYMDGKTIETRALGVQTALASCVRHLKINELTGYRDIYYALLFFPVGTLLGLVVTAPMWRRADRLAAVALWALLPAVILEWILMRATRAPFSIENAVLAVAYTLLGFLWINSDGAHRIDRAASTPALHSPAR